MTQATNARPTDPSRPTRLRRVIGRGAVASHSLWTRVRDKAFAVASRGAFAAFGERSVIQLPVRLNGVGASPSGATSSSVPARGSRYSTKRPSTSALDASATERASPGAASSRRVQSITIGRKVLMARNVYIADHRHAFADTARGGPRPGHDATSRPVEICDGAWLGQNVFVGPGVRIGRGAVVGANSVVLHDVPEHAVAVGAPARVVRRRSARRR